MFRPFKIVRFDSIPVTTPARALIDSSSVLRFDLLRRAVREALALRRVTIKEFITTPGQRHRNLHAIIADGYVPTRNEFEDAVLDLIDEGGFTRPDVNKWITVGGKPTQPDFRWPEQRLVIEADGDQLARPSARAAGRRGAPGAAGGGGRAGDPGQLEAGDVQPETDDRAAPGSRCAIQIGGGSRNACVRPTRLTEDPWPDSFPCPQVTPPSGWY